MPGTGKPGKILVIKLGALGDVVLALPHIARIQAAHPGQRVVLLTAPEYTPLLTSLPDIEVVAFPRKGFIAMARLLHWLSGQRVEMVYDLQGSLRSRIMTLLSLAPKRVGGRADFAYTHAPAAADPLPRHAFDRLNLLLAATGIEPARPDWRLPVMPVAASRVNDWLQGHGLTGQSLALLHAGSSPRWPSKRWPVEHFRELAQVLAGRGIQVIWIGGSDDTGLNRALASTTGIAAGGEFSYPELAALARQAVFAVTNDSGPMHILAAAGLPVYACFGPTDWQRSHALGQENRVLTNPVACSPCHLKSCPPERQHTCLQGISPATVIARLETDGFLCSEAQSKNN
jgi:ADP-heptose:LPS heptosyltransferase